MRGNPQLDYPVDLDPWLDGSVIDNRDKVVEDHVAIEEIGFGKALVSAVSGGDVPGLYPNDPVQVPKRNVAAAIAAGDLITGNVVNAKLNGVAIAPVTFASTCRWCRSPRDSGHHRCRGSVQQQQHRDLDR